MSRLIPTNSVLLVPPVVANLMLGRTIRPRIVVRVSFVCKIHALLHQTTIELLSSVHMAFLSAYGPPRPRNISNRYRDYREYYKMLKKERLWHNPLYINRKHELGIFIDDVREVVPNCVVGDVRKRWPNPPEIPYEGHVPTMTH